MEFVWFLFGGLTVFVAMIAWQYKQSNDVELTWFQWAAAIGWALWAVMTVAFVISAIAEGEPRAAGVGALIFGGVAALSFIGVRFLFKLGGSAAVAEANTESISQ